MLLGSIVVFLVVLSLLVLVHELGHFVMARKFGVMVEEFGFGLPPRIFGKKIGETIYSINWLFFGGFVRLHGETNEEGIAYPKRAFLNKGKKARISIVIAGVIMNFLLALVAFGIVYSFSGIPRAAKIVKVLDIAQGSPALSAGILVGDVIKKVDKVDIADTSQFQNLIQESKGKSITLEVETGPSGNHTIKNISVAALKNDKDGRYYIGISIPSDIYFPPLWQRPFYGIYYGFKEALFWGWTILTGLWIIISQLIHGQVPQGVAGPVGIFAVTTEAARSGIMTLINFVGVLSVNLAILNIIPFPALDGGRLLFIGIESVIGKKVVPKVEATIHTVGMIILLLLLLAITISDVRRLILTGSIDGFLKSVAK